MSQCYRPIKKIWNSHLCCVVELKLRQRFSTSVRAMLHRLGECCRCFVCTADELALDFDQSREIVLNNFRSELSTGPLACIENIDRRLSELTHIVPEHWTEEALHQSEEWKRRNVFARLLLWTMSPSAGRGRSPRAMCTSGPCGLYGIRTDTFPGSR